MTQKASSRPGEFNTTQSNQGTTGGAMREVADQAKETAGQVADQAQQVARQVTDQTRQQVSAQVTTQKDRAADGLSHVAQALRQTGQQLREQDQAGITQYIDRAASQVEQFSNYLQRSDMGQLVDDVEHFARRRPALFLGGVFALGMLGARFLKSSRQQLNASSNYPLATRQDYPSVPGIYAQSYQQRTATETSPYGTTTGTWPTSGVEEQP